MDRCAVSGPMTWSGLCRSGTVAAARWGTARSMARAVVGSAWVPGWEIARNIRHAAVCRGRVVASASSLSTARVAVCLARVGCAMRTCRRGCTMAPGGMAHHVARVAIDAPARRVALRPLQLLSLPGAASRSGRDVRRVVGWLVARSPAGTRLLGRIALGDSIHLATPMDGTRAARRPGPRSRRPLPR